MPRTLEDILKQRGYTDADIQAIQPLLSDTRFRSSMEQEFGAIETDRDTLRGLNDQWQKKLDEEFNPAITRAEKEAADARIRAAQLEEQVKIARDYGYLTDDKLPTNPNPNPNPNPAPPVFDPKEHKLVTVDDVARFADAEGAAIAMAADLSEEYRHLFGKSLYDYTRQTDDGRTLRGMTALREEAKQARQPLGEYVSRKFDFSKRREELAAEERRKQEDAIRADERAKLANEYGNPMLRTPAASHVPFIPAKTEKSGNPWERGTPDQLRSARIDRAMRTQQSA